jgi:hypothetical protein
MPSSILFKIKESVDIDKHRIIELFFKDWVDDSCDNEVKIKIERDVIKDWIPGMVYYVETFRVDFDKPEDAVALRLRGIPPDFENYLELVN